MEDVLEALAPPSALALSAPPPSAPSSPCWRSRPTFLTAAAVFVCLLAVLLGGGVGMALGLSPVSWIGATSNSPFPGGGGGSSSSSPASPRLSNSSSSSRQASTPGANFGIGDIPGGAPPPIRAGAAAGAGASDPLVEPPAPLDPLPELPARPKAPADFPAGVTPAASPAAPPAKLSTGRKIEREGKRVVNQVKRLIR